MSKNLWTREELILSFNLYLKIPFGKISGSNSQVKELASIINRTPASISMRLSNFASIDPFHQSRGVKGLENAKKQVQPIWDEFFNNQEELVFLSETILASKENTTIEAKYKEILRDITDLKGEDIRRLVKTRVNQSVFREIVLLNYSYKCAITGIDIPHLLYASHIVPWSRNEKERLNPENGICLSALYDRAFDQGDIGIDKDYRVLLSRSLKKKVDMAYYATHFAPIENTIIATPSTHFPKKEFLEYHLDIIFDKK